MNSIHHPKLGEIQVSLRANARFLRIRIRDLHLYATAPKHVSKIKIEGFIHKNEEELSKMLSQRVSLFQKKIKEGVMLCSDYPIYFKNSSRSQHVKAITSKSQATILIPIDKHSSLPDIHTLQSIQKVLDSVCLSEAKRKLSQRMQELSTAHGLPFRQLSISKAYTRWGSCNSDRCIRLNFRLIQLPQKLIDYVILHELCHTIHLNHGKEFHEKLASVYPDKLWAEAHLKDFSI